MYILIAHAQYEIPNSYFCFQKKKFNTARIPREGLQTCQLRSLKTKLILNYRVQKKTFLFSVNFFQEIYFRSRQND